MSRLTLRLFGTPRIECDGSPVVVDTRKALALLAYLALTRQQQSRDTLAALLWPDYDQSHARATLRRTLSALNKALPAEGLAIDRETITLNLGADLFVDVDAFHRALAACKTHGHAVTDVCEACIPLLNEAVGLYSGDFLNGFNLRDSPTFENWQFFQAESLRRELGGALERLTRYLGDRGASERATGFARRWLALDPLHEPAHRYLMLLYAQAGQRSAALHQYRACVQVLERELGVAPLEATTALYEAIKENRIGPVRQAAQVAQPAQVAAPAGAPREHDAGAGRVGEGGASAEVAGSGDGAGATGSVTDEGAATGASQDALPVAALSHTAAPRQPVYPLVGRGGEWATLLDAYAASSGTGAVIVLEGEAGIGKTRLAGDFLAQIQRQGTAVVGGRCYEGDMHLAYAPIVSGLRGALARHSNQDWLKEIPALWLCEAARILPELGLLRPNLPSASPLDGPGAQSRFFEGLYQVLLAACPPAPDGQPGVLFFDDAHWADGATLDLLTYVTRRLHEHPLCLMLTWRNNEVLAGHRLLQLLVEARRAGNATVITLSRLNVATVRELALAVARSDAATPLSKELVKRVWQETEGVPFFLVEYLTALSKGVLAPGSDEWWQTGGARDLLHSRLDGVSETGWQLLNAAAVIGRSFDFDTLREASGRSEEETVTGLEELIAQGVVAEVRGSAADHTLTYDFSHEKLRSLVYDETSLARRRLLHRRVAEAFAARAKGRRDADALAGQIAQHYLQGGNETVAAEYFKQAGEYARSLYANAQALTYLQTALALGHPEVAALHEAIGDVQTLLGEYGGALKSYETAAALCPPEALASIEHRLGNVYARRGEWELAESHLQAALEVLPAEGHAAERARITADRSLSARQRGERDTALALAQEALALAEDAGDLRALAQVHNMLGVLATGRGALDAAREHLERSLALAESLNEPSVKAAALNNLALACGASGDIGRAIEYAEAALALCVALGDRHREAALHNNLADLLYSAGRSEESMTHLKQAVGIYAEIGVEAGAVQPEIWKLTEW
ncbi:MAG: AAA family ATPase [Ktedonobacterales bacterium]